MAELSTIARPYAEGLWQALTEHKTSAAKIAKIGQVLESLADMAKDPQVSELVRDPKLTDDQIFEAVTGALGKGLSPELSGLIRVVIENGRLEALPEIAAQYFPSGSEGTGKGARRSGRQIPGCQAQPHRQGQSRIDRRGECVRGGPDPRRVRSSQTDADAGGAHRINFGAQ